MAKKSKILDAILIDPVAQTVEMVKYDNSTYKNMYPLMQCEIFTIGVTLENDDVVFVDDEGLMKPNAMFFIKGAHQPFAGRGLILGPDSDDDEGSTSAQTTLEDIKARVSFPTRAQVLKMVRE